VREPEEREPQQSAAREREVPARPDSAVVRMMLGGQLRRFREAADVTADAAAWRIRASRSKISRMELGRVGFKERDVCDLLELYGVTDPQVRAGMMALTTQANAQAWWAEFGDVLPGWFEPYLGLEAAAQRIRTFDLQFINGLFQTEAYARAVSMIGLTPAPANEVDRRVAIRLKRQELLTTVGAPHVWSVVDEAALRRPVGGRDVMIDQLHHLVKLARLPNVTLQVIPFSVGGHDAAGGSFTLLRFSQPDISDVVYLEQLTGAQYLEKRSDVDHYLDVIDRLSAASLRPDDTIRFLTQVIRETQSQRDKPGRDEDAPQPEPGIMVP
jgi:hypothetical protein